MEKEKKIGRKNIG